MATKITTRVLADDAVTDAKIADVTLTTATQAASDNTTKIATTAYVTTAIANLADSAPSTLNTLNELAAALGDDANYATTTTNAIAAKLPLAGGTVTGNTRFNTLVGINKAVNSSVGLSVGADATATNSYGLEVCNSTSNTRFLVDGVGSSLFYKSDNALGMKFDASTGNVGIGTSSPLGKLSVGDGSINDAGLPVQISTGADGTQAWYAVNRNGGYGALFGYSASSTYKGLVLRNVVASGTSNADGISFMTNNTSMRMHITGDGKVGIGSNDPDTQLHVKNTGGIELRLEADSNNNGQEDCFVRFYTDGKTQEGIVGMDNNNSSTLFSGNTENGMVFGTVSNLPTLFATNNTERMQIDASGRVLMGIQSSTTPEEGGTNAGLEVVGESSGRFNALRLSNKYTVSTGTASTGILFGAHTSGGRDNALIEVQNTANGGDHIELQFHVRDNANNLQKRHVIRYDGSMHTQPDTANVQHFYGNTGGEFGGNSSHNVRAASNLFMFNAGGGSGQFIFEVNGSNRGAISSSSSSGVFSDRDMKENIQDIEIGLSEVLQLRPRRFKYKTGAHETYGFIAQEVETAVPLAVDEIELPEADVEANKTNLKTLDTTSLIAALVKSIQELEARIATLEG